MNRTMNKLKIMLVAALAVAVTSCGDDDEKTPAPIASFGFEVDETNKKQVSFSNTSQNGETYAWNFGDGSGTSTEKDPSYTYAEDGTYTVTLTVTNGGGTDEATKEVTIISEPADLIANGGFDDDAEWNIISHNSSGNGLLTIADGVATFDEATDVASGNWGSEAHMGLYQAVEITEAGTYQVDLDITINGFDEVWFEVWIGTTEPVEGADYNTPAVKVLTANAWDCKDTQGTYSGSLAENYCDPNSEDGIMNGTIDLQPGTYYFVIRSGGFTFGDGGIVVDNVSMVKVN
jgi:PKD repeat protein